MTAAAAAQHSDDERAVDASERDSDGDGAWSIDVLTRGSRRPQIRHAPPTVRRLYSPRYRRAVISDSSSIQRAPLTRTYGSHIRRVVYSDTYRRSAALLVRTRTKSVGRDIGRLRPRIAETSQRRVFVVVRRYKLSVASRTRRN